ncbi:Nitrile-specifier protein 5 [Tetrabaena socialis]|uniref:Nitrile-specifier protein 5 n=1 Tax=Tetrabaena socialis TaxID=47790 RepID=A0A2J8ADW2_9CHLO|nr:Nitrile-specifier protein 5 [Tetrabaena socialis]|eukprot:PNH10707.1 Nitrile-specifier protein 5 [Tetrabaena socialis]
MRWARLPQSGAQPVARSSHSITVVDDKLYLLGGEHDPRVPVGSDVYEYSFTDGIWRVLEAKGEPPIPRVAHAAAAVGSTLYAFGGRSGLEMGEGASNDLFSFHIPSATWTRLTPNGPPPPLRSYHTMTSVGNRLYVFGGCGEAGRLNDLHVYDTETNTWAALAAPSEAAVPGRGGTCLVPAAGRKGLYVIAGFCGRELDDMHFYSLMEYGGCCWKSLEAGGESPGPRGWFASATTPDGRLVVHGGLDANNERLADMFVLDVHA